MTGEFRFQCPVCGQHIQASTGDSGLKVNCPSCKGDIVVPDPAVVPKLTVVKGEVIVPVPLHAHGAPRAPGAGPPPPPPPPPMCRLAVVSLVLSLSSVVIWPFGFIPGIICGRKAKAEMKRDPTLRGLEFAKAGLAIGYGFAALFGAAAIGAAILFFKPFGHADKQAKKTVPPVAPVQQPATNLPAAAKTSFADRGWTLDLTNMIIPPWPAAGKIYGREFKYDRAGAGTNVLVLREGTNLPHNLSVAVIYRLKSGESLSGKRFEVRADTAPGQPPVLLRWHEDKGEFKSQMFTNGYAMKLEFGNVTSGKIAGTIYLCLPDTNNSYVAGTFDATLIKPKSPEAKQGKKGKKRSRP